MGIFSDKNIKINSVLLGLYISLNMITKIITSFYTFQNNILLITSLIFAISMIINKFKINRTFVFFNIVIILLLLFSMFRVTENSYTYNYFFSYFLYGLVATYLILFKVDFKKVTIIVNFIFLIYTIILLQVYIPIVKTSVNLDFTMDLSYTSIIGICSVALSVKYFKKKKILIVLELIALIINIWFVLILSNNRGAIIVLIILVYLMLLKKIKTVVLKNILIFGSVISSFLLINNLEKIITNVYNFYLSYFNFRINWVERFLFQIHGDDISSGRDILYRNAYNLFLDNAIIGRGIGYFEINNNGQYPHNILLQILCEFGLVAAVCFVFLLIISLIYIITSNVMQNENEIDLLRLFFILSIPRLMISSTYWELHFFWLYLFIFLVILKKSYKSIEV